MSPIDIGGAALEYHEEGSGAPVVFVHGAPSDHRMWLAHCALLSTSHRAIRYSQRGFGRLPWNESWPPFGVRLHADDLVGLLARVGAPAHVVAWSYGGHVALLAAHERPELFRSAFVYEPGVPSYVTEPTELAALTQDAERMFGPVFAAVAAGELERAVRCLLDGSGEREGYFDSQPAARRQVQLENAHVLPRLLSQAPPPPLAAHELAAIRVPVTIAWGACTRPLFGIVARAAARAIPHRTHHEVTGATHMWPEERPGEFVELVLDTLER